MTQWVRGVPLCNRYTTKGPLCDGYDSVKFNKGWNCIMSMGDCSKSDDGDHVPEDMEIDGEGDVIAVCSECGKNICHDLHPISWTEY